MSGWVCRAGGTLLIPSGPTGKHFYIILNDPCPFDGYAHDCCISVSFGSIRKAPYDKTCTVEVGEHDFIKHPSYVVYSRPRFDPEYHILQMVQSGEWLPHNDASKELLKKVYDGLYKSKRTPNFIKHLERPK